MPDITNVEFMLLGLISENDRISGYRLNGLVQERGFREWADIGTTSIYNGLKKLKEKKCVVSAADRYKKGKGPKGVVYSLSPEGVALLREETRKGLSGARDRGARFMLALASIHILAPEEVIEALGQRVVRLTQEVARLRQISKQQEAAAILSFAGELLFRYSFAAIEHQIFITKEIISRFEDQDGGLK